MEIKQATFNSKFQVYSGFLQKGVSGGMIVNQEGRVIGVANFSWPDLHIGAGTSLESVKNFLKN